MTEDVEPKKNIGNEASKKVKKKHYYRILET
jgi:hypothetical protein